MVSIVAGLVEKYKYVGMIGDGVNDAPALARATIGLAKGAVGSDAAIETTDTALMSDDLSKLPWLIQHSRATLAIIHQNVPHQHDLAGHCLICTYCCAERS